MSGDGESEDGRTEDPWSADTRPSASRLGIADDSLPPGALPEVTPEAELRYRDGGEVGRGGLGQVLSTYDQHLGRDVARKELLLEPAVGSSDAPPDQTARFLREARVTAQLEHPNIVPVYELGRRPDGTLYYTMKLVRGRTLRKALEGALDLQDRLSLLPHFVDLCQAIAYAHSRGVIHRDIKPDNVMIGEFGETLVLDWGVAKVRGKNDLQSRDLARAIARMRDEASAQTIPGSAFGTPAYMSPEQARGQLERIDERSDVWSLGVVLYQLMSGRLPYPPGPVLSLLLRVAKADLLPVEEAAPEAPPELLAVVRRALAGSPEDRYGSAKELAEEVQTFLSGGWVEAHRYSPAEVLRRWLREHRRAVVTAAVAAAIGLAAVAGAWTRVLGERDRALAAESRARRGIADALVARARLAANRRAWSHAELFGASALEAFPHPQARGLLALAISAPRAHLRWSEQTYAGCAALAGAADGRLACATSLGVVVFDARGERIRTHPSSGWASFVALDVTGEWAASATERGLVEVWETRSGQVRAQFPGGPVTGLGFHQGALYVGRRDLGLARIAPPFRSPEPIAGATRFASGAALAVGGGGVVWIDPDRRVRSLQHGAFGAPLDSPPTALAIGPDGEVAVATESRRLRFARGGGLFVELSHEGQRFDSLAFASSEILLAGTADGEIQRIETETGAVSARWIAHEGSLTALTPVPNGCASAGADRRLRVFRVDPGLPAPPPAPGALRAAAFGRPGTSVAVTRDGRAWTLSARAARPRTLPPGVVVTALAATPEGWTALGGARGAVTIVSPRGEPGAAWTESAPVTALAFAYGGSALFVGTETNLTRRSLEGRPGMSVAGETECLGFSTGRLARVSRGRLELLDASDGRQLRSVPFSTDEDATALALDGSWLAVGTAGGEVEIRALPDLGVVARASTGPSAVRALEVREDTLWARTARGDLAAFELSVLSWPAEQALDIIEDRTGLRRKELEVTPR